MWPAASSCEISALGSSTSYSKAAAQKSARAGAFMLSMTNFQPSGIRPVSRECDDPSNRKELTVRKPRIADRAAPGHLNTNVLLTAFHDAMTREGSGSVRGLRSEVCRNPSALRERHSRKRTGLRTPARSDAEADDYTTRKSSRSPALMLCCTRFAPITPTSLSPAAAFACATALWRPSLTNVKGDPSDTHSGEALWVTTKTGTSNGCLPPHP
jgi:hypothetical protein